MTCNYCNSDNFKYLTSSTNSTYTYCRDCNTNFDITYKNVIIDSMLKKLLETLKCVKTDYLKIEVKKYYNTIGLIINNINVFEMDFKYEEYLPLTLNLETNHHELKKFILTNAPVEEAFTEIYEDGEKHITFY